MKFSFKRADSRIADAAPTLAEVPQLAGADIAGLVHGQRVGGDFYQFARANPRRVLFGLLDVAGEPPHVTAARELKEEVGLEARIWRVLVDLNTAPGFSDESVRVYLATELSEVDRPQAHNEEADMTMRWIPIVEAVRLVLGGEVLNSIAVAGILAAHTVISGFAQPRPVDSPWVDKPTAFAARKAAQ